MFHVKYCNAGLPCPKELTLYTGMAWKSRYSITYRAGNATFYFLPERLRPEIERARVLTAEVIGQDPSEIKPTYSAMARAISQYIGVNDTEMDERTIPTIVPTWHYQACIPTKCTSGIALFDMKSAYWQIGSKCDSLRVSVLTNGKIIQRYMSPSEQRKWDRVREVCGEIKPLRLSIIGVNSVGYSSHRSYQYYYRGKLCTPNGEPPTWFQPLSLLTVRVAYELTQLQANYGKCVYANADCVSIESGKRPEVWDALQLEMSVKGEGELDLRAVGCYKIGGKPTKNFNEERSNSRYTPAKQIPAIYYKTLFKSID